MSEPRNPVSGRRVNSPVPAGHAGHSLHHEILTTQQIREVGRRRTDAEEKLAQHLREARHKSRDSGNPETPANP
ncbi:hypothetical protein [Arthrobacter sp. PAMC25284]|uniref:Uncharacterized protein n=1 Tax=Arthrobacter oryzae TaxID=409290 RepID=A0A3N0C1E5_9MICC|nr:hypothetical protein [Arthrobacter sp. PAMC25284]QYF90455.1 hypothetical protein KY499_03865 [Arthrobacter sp. PAMC25284]RNL55651.1 hypothetical protein D7003_09550 [Arthrobacter oryzae]